MYTHGHTCTHIINTIEINFLSHIWKRRGWIEKDDRLSAARGRALIIMTPSSVCSSVCIRVCREVCREVWRWVCRWACRWVCRWVCQFCRQVSTSLPGLLTGSITVLRNWTNRASGAGSERILQNSEKHLPCADLSKQSPRISDIFKDSTPGILMNNTRILQALSQTSSWFINRIWYKTKSSCNIQFRNTVE